MNNTESEDEIEDDACEEYYKKICNHTLLMPLIKNLDECNLLKDFITLIEVLSKEVENKPLLLCL